MLIFLDESGDPGFKFDKGSSKFFVIALVIFDNPLDAEETALKIKRLREKLKLSPYFEFKFNKLSNYYRYQFFEAIRGCSFRLRVMVVNKQILHSSHLTSRKESFYSYFVSELFKHNQGNIAAANIKIDGSGDKAFKKAFQTYLRQKLREGVIGKFKFVDSKTDSLIQLADMVSGAVYRAYNPDKQDKGFYDRITPYLVDIWEFDKKNWSAS